MSKHNFNQPVGSCLRGNAGFVGTFLFILAVALLLSCSKKEKEEHVAEKLPEAAAEPESHVKRGTNGEVIITLDADTQKTMGLQTAPLKTAQWKPQLKGYGRVLDPAPLAALVAELITAKAAAASSEVELKRVQSLAAQNNASARALQLAEAAAARDQAQVDSTRLRMMSSWGRELAGRADLPAFIRSLAALDNALVEVDLPPDAVLDAVPKTAQILTLAPNAKPLTVELIGPAPMTPAPLQGRGFLFLLAPNEQRLAPGAVVTGLIEQPGEPQSGAEVPRAAVVRHLGAAWAYFQRTENTFERAQLSLDHPLPDGWFMEKNFKPGDKVVVVGAQQLLSEELKGGGVD
jgi:hypothetical protein